MVQEVIWHVLTSLRQAGQFPKQGLYLSIRNEGLRLSHLTGLVVQASDRTFIELPDR